MSKPLLPLYATEKEKKIHILEIITGRYLAG